MAPTKQERVLVTGGAGFIGSHLCERLLNEGHQVHVLDNFNDFYDPGIKRNNLAQFSDHENVEITEGDIRDEALLRQIFKWNPTAIVHLAAMAGVRPSIQRPDLYMSVNLVGTARLLQAAEEQGTRRIVFASSSSVYGNRKDVPFRETDPVDDPISPYAASKKGGELLCHTYHHLFDMDISCLRFFTVFGPRQRPEMAIHKFVRAILTGEEITVFGDGSSSRDYTYVDDCVEGICKALEQLSGYQIFNIGQSTPITLTALIDTIESVIGLPAMRRQLPS